MCGFQEIELPRKTSVTQIEKILQKLDEINCLRLTNDMVKVNIVKINMCNGVYLVFGDHYVIKDCDDANWDYINYITDSVEDLAFFIHSL